MCLLCPKFVVSEKTVGRSVAVALRADHTPNLMSHNGNSFTSLALSSAFYLLFFVFTLPMK
jgi:hypothetical protein